MMRWVFTVTSVMSLLLCAGIVALWAHSYAAADGFSCTRYQFTEPLRGDGTIPQDHYVQTGLESGRGCLCFWRGETTQDEGNHDEFEETKFFAYPVEDLRPKGSSLWLWLGFWADFTQPQFGIPTWTLVLATAILPYRRWCRSRRVLPGCCVTCGYDLRASKDRCPECGTAIPAKAEATA